MPNPKWKQEIDALNSKSETGADAFLDKLKASKWTALSLLGAAALVIVLLLRIF